jgi:hypothetical protein
MDALTLYRLTHLILVEFWYVPLLGNFFQCFYDFFGVSPQKTRTILILVEFGLGEDNTKYRENGCVFCIKY